LPNEFPPWKSVYTQYRAWVNGGTFKKVHTALRKKLKKVEGKTASPFSAIVDSQSVKITYRGGRHGLTVVKKTNSRKRHILADMDGLLLSVKRTEANINDRKGLISLLTDLTGYLPHIDHPIASV